MPWEAFTESDDVDTGAILHIDRGYGDVPPQPAHLVTITNLASGKTKTAEVVSASADRLELRADDVIITLKSSTQERTSILDRDGKYYESWIVL